MLQFSKREAATNVGRCGVHRIMHCIAQQRQLSLPRPVAPCRSHLSLRPAGQKVKCKLTSVINVKLTSVSTGCFTVTHTRRSKMQQIRNPGNAVATSSASIAITVYFSRVVGLASPSAAGAALSCGRMLYIAARGPNKAESAYSAALRFRFEAPTLRSNATTSCLFSSMANLRGVLSSLQGGG